MFNETCGQNESLVDVGGDNPVCLTEAERLAFEASERRSLGTVEVRPQAKDAWTTYAIYGGLALLALAMLKR